MNDDDLSEEEKKLKTELIERINKETSEIANYLMNEFATLQKQFAGEGLLFNSALLVSTGIKFAVRCMDAHTIMLKRHGEKDWKELNESALKMFQDALNTFVGKIKEEHER